MDKIERIPRSEFPDALHVEAIEHITRYTVGISGIDLRDKGEVSHQSGTGTLVDLDGTLCLVTADHVIEDIRHHHRMGLLIDWQGGLRRCSFEMSHLQFVRLPRGVTADVGPDLGAIVLPRSGEGVEALKSHKVFYNLRKRIERFDSSYPALSSGVWFPCGVLEEESRELPPVRGFSRVTGRWGMVGRGFDPIESKRDGFDYLDLRGRPRVDPDMPDSFGGASGGGLWQGLIARESMDRLVLREVILSGVIFYQSPVEGGFRTLRSHGRVSLHERLADAITHESTDRSVP